MPTRRPALLTATALILALAAGGCSDDDDPQVEKPPVSESTTATSAPDPSALTLGVYGSEDELKAWDAVASSFNAISDTGEATLVEWRDHESAQESIESGEVPDVFMVSQRDMGYLMAEELTRPVSELLDERGVDFGDSFSRDAVESFGLEGDLQCMAYSVSPMVMFINKDLVDFDKMERRGLDVPSRWDRWSLAEFEAAADFAARPARGTAGFYIEPSIQGLAPFIHSGGGSVFDEESDPTSLSFASEDTRAALEESLAVLRDASLTLTDEQLAKRPALEWFERGKLGMIAGYRDLVPEMRMNQKLSFDVASMPMVETTSTIGDVTGLCISSATKDAAAAADLIAYAVGETATGRVTRAGSMVPANLAVAASPEFLQTGRQPARSRVFNTAVRGMVIPPLLPTWNSWAELEAAVAPGILELFTAPGELDLDAVTEAIDEASRTVLDPDQVETESVDPEVGATGSPAPKQGNPKQGNPKQGNR